MKTKLLSSLCIWEYSLSKHLRFSIYSLILLFSFRLSAQTAFAPPGTIWNYYYQEPDIRVVHETLRSVKDTMIDNIVHRKITSHYEQWISNSEMVVRSTIYLLRQQNDSIYINNRFQYATNVQKGDTLHPEISVSSDSVYLAVDSIMSEYIFNEERKIIYFSQGNYNCNEGEKKVLKLVEGYGPVNDFLIIQPHNECTVGRFRHYNYSCGEYEGSLYQTSDNSMCKPLSVQKNVEHTPFKNSITPNPFNDQIRVEFEGPTVGNIEIYNSVGNKMMEKFIGAPTRFLFLDLSFLKEGTYFVVLANDKGKVLLNRITK